MSHAASDSSTPHDIKPRVDSAPWSMQQLLIVAICFLFNLSDGFDVIAMSMAAPVISEKWGVAPTSLGVIFSAALAGMTVGAMFLAPWSDKIGRRRMILASGVVMTVTMLATAYATTVTQLVVIRFITGIAIGAMLASVVTMTSEYAPARHKNVAIIVMQCGYALGAVVVGPVASYFVAQDYWQGIFVTGGVFSGLLVIMSWFWMPESLDYLLAKSGDSGQRLKEINLILKRIGQSPAASLPEIAPGGEVKHGSIGSLLSPSHRVTTLHLWGMFFLAFWANYFLLNWIPKLFVEAGYDVQRGIASLTLFTIGSLVGAPLMGALSTRFKLTSMISLAFVLCAVALAVYTFMRPEALVVLYAFMFLIGFTMSGGFTCLYAVASLSYPTGIRATGFGWCVGLGRAGAVLSPIVAGLLVAGGINMYASIAILAIPSIGLAAVLVYSLGKREAA